MTETAKMREVDRRTNVSRRVFLRSSAAAVPAAALAVGVASGITARAAWAQEGKSLSPHSLASLVRMARDIYPHDHIGDIYYVNAITPWDDKAAATPATKAMLEEGIALLDAAAQGRHGAAYLDVGWEADRVVLLQGIEQGAFFQAIRSDLVVSLYNQHDLWIKFGYEGSSADKGGYIHRGFGDIDWLPQA